jgi:hypothetical protein
LKLDISLNCFLPFFGEVLCLVCGGCETVVRMFGVSVFYNVCKAVPFDGVYFLFNMMFVLIIKYWVVTVNWYFIHFIALLGCVINVAFF